MRGDGGAPRGFRAQQKPLRIKPTRHRIWPGNQDQRTRRSTTTGQRTGPRKTPPKAARADKEKGTAKPDTPRTPGSSRGRSVTPANKRPAKAEPKRPRSERARRKKQPAGPRSTPRRRRDTGKNTKGAAGSHGADNGATKQTETDAVQRVRCANPTAIQFKGCERSCRSIWKTPGGDAKPTDENCKQKCRTKTNIGERGNSQLARERVC